MATFVTLIYNLREYLSLFQVCIHTLPTSQRLILFISDMHDSNLFLGILSSSPESP